MAQIITNWVICVVNWVICGRDANRDDHDADARGAAVLDRPLHLKMPPTSSQWLQRHAEHLYSDTRSSHFEQASERQRPAAAGQQSLLRNLTVDSRQSTLDKRWRRLRVHADSRVGDRIGSNTRREYHRSLCYSGGGFTVSTHHLIRVHPAYSRANGPWRARPRLGSYLRLIDGCITQLQARE